MRGAAVTWSSSPIALEPSAAPPRPTGSPARPTGSPSPAHWLTPAGPARRRRPGHPPVRAEHVSAGAGVADETSQQPRPHLP